MKIDKNMICKVINASKVDLEQLLNDWLKDNPAIEIKYITQTESGSNGYITMTIFYLDLKETRKKKLEQIENN